jgi:hypothetical protein
MRPALLCGLTCCASLIIVTSALAKEPGAAKPKVRGKAAVAVSSLQVIPSFKGGIAAIIANRATLPVYVWSDIDRSRLVDQFRLPDGKQRTAAPTEPLTSVIVDKVRRREARGMSFGLDGGSANLGPPVDAAARPAEVVAYHLSEASTCNGLMPNVDCNTIGGDDYTVRLALALNF